MQKIHEDATPLRSVFKDKKHIGWRYVHPAFIFDAIQHNEDLIFTYVCWTELADDALSSYSSWEDVRTDLDLLIRVASL